MGNELTAFIGVNILIFFFSMMILSRLLIGWLENKIADNHDNTK